MEALAYKVPVHNKKRKFRNPDYLKLTRVKFIMPISIKPFLSPRHL